jgi:hypothetical protein
MRKRFLKHGVEYLGSQRVPSEHDTSFRPSIIQVEVWQSSSDARNPLRWGWNIFRLLRSTLTATRVDVWLRAPLSTNLVNTQW